ncbi:expressed unknown protein [Seminavis robusta]|uniref:SET domain-containing protein n=1 Tax=Seminavis robusta TaxID=568900 RepID=A0A9N8EN99_9STRA|nr:expressed unknown protein [Seminavis robusta]|eukprot:Sro1304_g261090.1 n/a (513) ;mRNA; f:18957-20623
MSRKRPRREGWWQQAVDWVNSKGGNVHESVRMSDDRELYLETSQQGKTEIMRIPFACLVSKKSIESTAFGKQIVECVGKVDSDKFHSQVFDIVIALYLANYSATSVGGNKEVDDTPFRPYLETLPESSSYDGLPRLWLDDDLKNLQGSPLLQRVNDQKKGIRNDYNLALEEWKQSSKFPSFEAFSYSLAAVTSRAFAGFGSPEANKESDDMNVAMVPLLDLCNHCRGKNETKNLSYERGMDSNMGSVIVVTASRNIETGEKLRITYGARSNAQLLYNYGFCIPDNIEPDGSANDFLEVSVGKSTETNTTVKLQAGPKAYSFHGFINALDSFIEAPTVAREKEEGGEDDFDANEKEFERWDMDLMASSGDGEEDEDEQAEIEDMKKQEEQAVDRYLKALVSFENRMQELRSAYHLKGKELVDALNAPLADPNKRHAVLLIQSEQRTIYFVLCVIHRLHSLLRKTGESTGRTITAPDGSLVGSDEDKKILEDQAKEVSSAFLSIRLPGWKEAHL